VDAGHFAHPQVVHDDVPQYQGRTQDLLHIGLAAAAVRKPTVRPIVRERLAR
jgi:hypothetical protein